MTTSSVPAPFRIRSVTPRDRARLTRLYADLSPDSRAARFHGASPVIPKSTTTFFCGPDHQHREGIVAECVDATGDPVIIGHLCIEPIADGVAEMAIVVADAWQGRGVGRAMLTRAIAWAEVHGVARLLASMQSGNAAMFALLRSLDHPITYGATTAGTVDAYLDVRRPRPLAA